MQTQRKMLIRVSVLSMGGSLKFYGRFTRQRWCSKQRSILFAFLTRFTRQHCPNVTSFRIIPYWLTSNMFSLCFFFVLTLCLPWSSQVRLQLQEWGSASCNTRYHEERWPSCQCSGDNRFETPLAFKMLQPSLATCQKLQRQTPTHCLKYILALSRIVNNLIHTFRAGESEKADQHLLFLSLLPSTCVLSNFLQLCVDTGYVFFL